MYYGETNSQFLADSSTTEKPTFSLLTDHGSTKRDNTQATALR